jgi:hypothetical protein
MLYGKYSPEQLEEVFKGDPRCPIPVGARVEKVNTEPGDTYQDGTKGVVRGSKYVDDMPTYLVSWEEMDEIKEKFKQQVGEVDEHAEFLQFHIQTKLRQIS